jgi:hypothetical protein
MASFPSSPALGTASSKVESEIIESSFTPSTSNAQSEKPEAPFTPSNKLTDAVHYLNTPTARTENSIEDTLVGNLAYARLAQKIQPHLVGPMPLDMFFEEFLPETKLPMPPSERAFDDVPQPEQGKQNEFREWVMNAPLVS